MTLIFWLLFSHTGNGIRLTEDPKRAPQVYSWLSPLKQPNLSARLELLGQWGEKTQGGTGPLQTGWTGLRGKRKGRARETPLAVCEAD